MDIGEEKNEYQNVNFKEDKITEEITEQITKNNNDTNKKILNMSRESYDYYNFLTGRVSEEPTSLIKNSTAILLEGMK